MDNVRRRYMLINWLGLKGITSQSSVVVEKK